MFKRHTGWYIHVSLAVVASTAVFVLPPANPASAAPPTIIGGLSSITQASQYPGAAQVGAVDGAGNTYIRDYNTWPSKIMKIAPGGAVSTFAGTGVYGFTGDGGQATSAQVGNPYSITSDTAGNVYFADEGRVRRVATNGTITTVAGTGTFVSGGDGGPATSATFGNISSISVNGAGTVLTVADGRSIRQATIGGNISTISGSTSFVDPCTNSFPVSLATARFDGIYGLVVGSGGARYAYVSCGLNYRLLKEVAGNWTVFGGGGATATPTDGAASTTLQLSYPNAVQAGPGDTVYASYGNSRLVSFKQNSTVEVIAGDSQVPNSYVDGSAAAAVAVTLFAVNPASASVALFTPKFGRLVGGTTLDVIGADIDAPDGTLASSVVLPTMTGLASDSSGTVYLATGTSALIRTINSAGVLGTKGGGGNDDPPTYGAPATQSALFFVRSLNVASSGQLQFILQNDVASIDAGGILRRVTRSGNNGPDGGLAADTTVSPIALATAGDGRTLILGRANPSGAVIRTINSSGIIGTMFSSPDSYWTDLAGAPDGSVVLAPGTGIKLVRVAANGGTSDIAYPAGIGNDAQIVVDPAGTIFMSRTTYNGEASLVKIAADGTATDIDNPGWGPIDLDAAGNVYVSVGDKVLKYAGIAAPKPTTPNPPANGTVIKPLSPVRLFDTRPGEAQGAVTVEKKVYGGAGNILKVKVTGVDGVPETGVGAVSLNVTATEPIGPGFITVFPCGDRPTASNLNYTTGQTVPNAVLTPVSASGEVCFFSSVNTHLIADVNGWFAASSGFAALSPVRLYDTRPGEAQGAVTVEKKLYGGAANILKVKVTGIGGVPESGVGAVSLNVTATETAGPGFITVFPCGDRPTASNLNYVTGQTVPNAVLTPVSASGEVCFFSSVNTHLIADVNGWFAASAGFTALSPVRLYDTRPGEAQGAVTVEKKVYGGAGNILKVKVTGVGGVPATGVGAVSLNVTATEPIGPGFITVFPCGDRPTASNLNYTTGQTVPNAVLTPVSASGEVCFFSSVDTHLIADINGWFAS